jgi:aldehyde:ferredoxin oxidoreductase
MHQTIITGSNYRIIEINLSDGLHQILDISEEDRRLYLGGKGLGLKLLAERLVPGTNPLCAGNYLVFMMGVFMGTGAPCSGRFAALTKSPLTGILTSCSCGGPFGMALKTAGYDGLLITGKSDHPVYLSIDARSISVHPADNLWGLDTQRTQKALGTAKKKGMLVIGPAGENKVLFANIASGHRFLGRGGMGAVMGAKKLKAVVVVGGAAKMVPEHPATFDKLKKRANKYIKRNAITGKAYRSYGTASHVGWCNSGGILPVRNFRDGFHEKAKAVSGKAMIARYGARYQTCTPCTILCGHAGTRKDGSKQMIPEYETVGLLGTNLGIFDPDRLTVFNDRCNHLGMDTISAGSVLAWVMEAGERGIVATDLEFGQPEGITDALEDIAYRKEFGDEMAKGTRYLGRTYRGEDFAIQVKGLELAAYDPRGCFGQGLAYAVANRGGCHLSAATFALESALALLNPYTTNGKAHFVTFFENLYAAINSLVTCQFSAYAYVLEPWLVKYTPKVLLRQVMTYLPRLSCLLMDVRLFSQLYSSITGIHLSQRKLLEAGARIHTLERLLNNREGISSKDDTLPARFLVEGRTCDLQRRRVPLAPMLESYYRLRGYRASGVPTIEKLHQLRIDVPGSFSHLNAENEPQLTVPRANVLKKYYLMVMMWFMGRAIEAAAKMDTAIKTEFDHLPAGFSFCLAVQPDGPALTMRKDEKGRPRYHKGYHHGQRMDLKISITSLEAAFVLFSFRESTITSATRSRLVIDGDISAGCAVIRIFDSIETYLLPKRLARIAVRRYPKIGFSIKIWRRGVIYLRTLAGV